MNVVSTDEKTGIQALESMQMTEMKAGQVERRDCNYKRHGTQCLIASMQVATGEVIAESIGNTRKEKDFVKHINKVIDQGLGEEYIIIVDQLNIHKSESLCKLIAENCGVKEDLGIKGKTGVLKNMKTRMKFLSDESHKIRFVYTPKHASWLNQIEAWFSILVRSVLERLSVNSVNELKEKMISFIGYYNQVMARPFRWICRKRIKRLCAP